MNRMLLYVHYNKFNELSPHVLYQLGKLRPLFSSICFISNSQLTEDAIEKLQSERLVDYLIQRQNEGYDFAAWKEGILSLFDNIRSFDSLTLMNDTCFGPLWSIQPIFDEFESDDTVDFWGLTNHAACQIKGGSYVAEHLQSYFLSFKAHVVKSKAFEDFWLNVEAFSNVQRVIDIYESKLTKNLVEAGFSYRSLLDLSKKPELGNVSIFRPDLVLQSGVPFVKIKSFSYASHMAPFVIKDIEENSDYPSGLIINHLSDILLPSESFLLPYKILRNYDNVTEQVSRETLVHLHFSTLNGLENIKNFFINHKKFELIISADSKGLLQTLKRAFCQEDVTILKFSLIKNVTDWQNFVNDVVLSLDRGYLAYMHVSDFFSNQLIDYWSLGELLDVMFSSEKEVKKAFYVDKKLGLVIPDLLSYERYKNNQVAFENEEGVLDKLDISEFELANPMLKRSLSAYWIRTEVLKKLVSHNIDLSFSDFEKIIPIINWKRRFDFALLPNKKDLPAFIDANRARKMLLASELDVPVSINYPVSAKTVLRFFGKATLLTLRYFLKRLNLIKLVKEKFNK